MSTSTMRSSSPTFCHRIREVTSTSRKPVRHRDTVEKHSDLIASTQIRGKVGAIRCIIEHTLRVLFREPVTADGWQQTYKTLFEISRDRYSSSLKSVATDLIKDIVQSMRPLLIAEGTCTHVHLVELLSRFQICQEMENDTWTLSPPMLLKGDSPITSCDNVRRVREVRILILGATGAGKSTVVNGILATHRPSQQGIVDFEFYRERLISDMIESMKTIIKEKAGKDAAASPAHPSDSLAVAELSILTFPSNLLHSLIHPISSLPFKLEDVSQALCMLWNAPSVQSTVDHLQAHGSLLPNANYFFDAASRIFASDYIPSHEDILRYKQELKILRYGSSTFTMMEVSWKVSRISRMHDIYRYHDGRCPGVVLFVADLSDYNKPASDSDTTRTLLDESIASFDILLNSRPLTETIIVLIFTKHETFEKELAYLPMQLWMPEYQGGTKEAAYEYIEKQYTSLVKDRDKLILTHDREPSKSLAGLLSKIQSKIDWYRENVTGMMVRRGDSYTL